MKFDLDALRNKIKEETTNTSNDYLAAHMLPDDSEVLVRILPLHDDSHWRVEWVFHQVPGDSSNIKHTCPEMYGKEEKCPFCEKARKLYNENNDDIAIQYWKKRRYLSQVVVRYHEDYDVTKDAEMPIVWGYGKKLDKKFTEGVMDDEIGVFFDPKEGIDFKLKKTTVSNFPNYDNSEFARKSSPLGTAPQIKEYLAARIDLMTKIKPVKTYDELLEIMNGGTPDETSSKDDSHKPARLPAKEAAPEVDEPKVEVEPSEDNEDKDFNDLLKKLQNKDK